ncbi:hypothetical protein MHTCC0001_08720 [Flavobacteriaceae bacterium MHTCC 0001]
MRSLKLFFFGMAVVGALKLNSQNNKTIDVDYGSIHYKTFGEGEPLLIINGGPGMNCEGFSSLAKLLDKNYKAILYDQRGTGLSKLKIQDSTTMTMDHLINDIEILRKHLGLNKWLILGHSFGGFVAQHYASKYPDKIKGMILSASGGVDMEIFSYLQANIHIRRSKQQRDSLKYWNDKIINGDTTYITKYNAAKQNAPIYLYGNKYINKIAHRLTQANPKISNLIFKDLFKNNYD